LHTALALRDYCERRARHPLLWARGVIFFRFGEAELFRPAHDLLQFLERLVLPVNQSLRIANDVDEQDVADVEFHFGRTLGRHEFFYLKAALLTRLYSVEQFLFRLSRRPGAGWGTFLSVVVEPF
jgi:hypothetical protein